jgi:hypothetical protein
VPVRGAPRRAVCGRGCRVVPWSAVGDGDRESAGRRRGTGAASGTPPPYPVGCRRRPRATSAGTDHQVPAPGGLPAASAWGPPAVDALGGRARAEHLARGRLAIERAASDGDSDHLRDGSGTAGMPTLLPGLIRNPRSGSGRSTQQAADREPRARAFAKLISFGPFPSLGAGPSPDVRTGGGPVPTFGRPLLVGPTATCVDTDVRHSSPAGPAAAPGGAAGRGHASGTCAASLEKSPDPEIDRGPDVQALDRSEAIRHAAIHGSRVQYRTTTEQQRCPSRVVHRVLAPAERAMPRPHSDMEEIPG